MLRKLIKLVTQRLFITIIILLIQVLFLIYIIMKFQESFIILYFITQLLGLLLILKIINSEINPGYKIAWIIPILIVPIFGILFYFIFGNKNEKKANESFQITNDELKHNLIQDEEVIKKLKQKDISFYTQANYLYKTAKFPIYNNTKVEYLKIGEIYFEKLLEELRKAEKYIFLEYFIIEQGYMWDTILEILKEKANSEVDVRVIYDDMGCIATLPKKYYKQLESYNIKCHSFNKFIPVLNYKLNCRDHRKIAIIDGKVGFTGGINLADEYINKKVRFGHWKDNGVMIKGDAVWSLTVIFLTTWNHIYHYKDNFSNFKPIYKTNSDGYIQPYNDTPLDKECVGENVYLNLINKANKSIYIMTPYLIIDNEMQESLKLAAKNGVDVRIIVPGIPDKKLVNEVTKAYYNSLLENDIKIYEYTKGFIHAKMIITDSNYASIGTVNMDYRSFYLHFECGVLMYDNSSIVDMEDDFMDILKECHQIKLEDTKISFLRSLKRAILRLFSPLM